MVTLTPLLVRRFVRSACAAALLTAATAVPVFAEEHRARMSADLVAHLAAGSQSIDVIVHGDQASVDVLAARYNVVVKRRMKSGGVLHVNAGQLDALQRDADIDHLSGDLPLLPEMAVTNVAIGADQVWAGDGEMESLTGRGVTVAVIDSGIDTRHHALRNRVIATMDFTGGDGVDRYGHGTHVAGIIAGQPGHTADTRSLQGVAAGAHLVNLRVLGDDGSGVTSSVIEAIDWAIEHQRQYHIGVINLSLGGPVVQPYRDDPMCEAVERAVKAGIVVVTAAGNRGITQDGKIALGSITSPGNDPYALTVGAIDTHGTPQR
jgi:serine protease AprX